jgi:hypothetical protein
MEVDVMSEAFMRAQGYAVSIEHSMSRVFNCNRGGVGGPVDSDYIRKHPYAAMCCALTAIYAIDPEKKSAIEMFVEDNMSYANWSIDDLVSFDTSEKVINGIEYSLDFANGEEALRNIISKFDALIK